MDKLFVSAEFESFLKRNSIQHLASAPYHPSSNGLAERAVKTFKDSVSKLQEGTLKDKISTFLFHNHITPQTSIGDPVYVRNFGRGPLWLPGHIVPSTDYVFLSN